MKNTSPLKFIKAPLKRYFFIKKKKKKSFLFISLNKKPLKVKAELKLKNAKHGHDRKSSP